MGKSVKGLARLNKAFKKHKYWKYYFSENPGEPKEFETVLLHLGPTSKLTHLHKADFSEAFNIYITPVVQSLLVADQVYRDSRTNKSVTIGWPLEEGEYLKRVSKDYYMFFSNLAEDS